MRMRWRNEDEDEDEDDEDDAEEATVDAAAEDSGVVAAALAEVAGSKTDVVASETAAALVVVATTAFSLTGAIVSPLSPETTTVTWAWTVAVTTSRLSCLWRMAGAARAPVNNTDDVSKFEKRMADGQFFLAFNTIILFF